MRTPHDEMMLDLVAVYALSAVDAGERAIVRDHIAECAICREEFRVARAATTAVALSASEPPPAQLRERILSSLPAQGVPLRRTRRSPWFIPAGAAAAIIIGAGIWWNAHRTAPQNWLAVCVPGITNCHASGVVTAPAPNRLLLRVSGLAALPAGKAYQAWLIEPGFPPKPEPTFSANEAGEGSVEISAAPAKGVVLAVTVEPAGGSRTPSTKPFLIAKIE